MVMNTEETLQYPATNPALPENFIFNCPSTTLDACWGATSFDSFALPSEFDEFELVPERNEEVRMDCLLVWYEFELNRDGKELGPD